MTLLILYAVLALGVSFLCSVFEAVLLSVTPAFIAAQEAESSERRRRSGRLWKRLKEDVDRPLAAILSLNTIAHTGGAAGVGAQAQTLYGETWVTVASAVMTLLILVLSEIIPKTLGAVYWRGLSPVVARSLRLLIWGMYPFVLLAQGLTRLLSRDKNASEMSREELGAMTELGRREGVLAEDEGRMMQSLLRMRSLTVRDVLTPRMVMLMLPEHLTVRDAMEQLGDASFSRIPLYGQDRDDVTGYMLRAELLLACARDDFGRTLAELRRPLVRLSGQLALPETFELLLTHREHLALVVDDFGGTEGLVTLEDVVETVLGTEILDEKDIAGDLRVLARERWRRRMARRGIHVEEAPATPPAELPEAH